jgi:uncharacterized protein (DUF433 family)
MNTRVRISEARSIRIAKAIFAGATHQEVAAEFGVTVRQVQDAVERVRRMIVRTSEVRAAAPARRVPPAVRPAKLEPVVWEPKCQIARDLGIKAVRSHERGPSVPYLRFLHGG